MTERDLERLQEVGVRLRDAPTDPGAHRSAHRALIGSSASNQDAWNHPVVRMVEHVGLRLLTYRLPAALRKEAESPFPKNGFDGWKAVEQYHANDGDMFDFWLQKPPEQS